MTNTTDKLNALKARERDLTGQLAAAQNSQQRTQSALQEARDTVAGYERSTRPHEMESCNQAKARLEDLTEQWGKEGRQIVTLEQQLAEVGVTISTFYDGDAGYQNALAIYQDAKRDAAKADTAAQAFTGQQAQAAQALAHARQRRASATADQQDALTPAAMVKARSALDSATHAVEDAETLLANLKRHDERLQADQKAAKAALDDARRHLFQTKAATLAGQLREQVNDLALEAFAAAQLAGACWSFREYLADVLDPHREAAPAGAEAHRQKLLTTLDSSL
jgi:predicted  nucleic acid-binding Zn-ribbon protein